MKLSASEKLFQLITKPLMKRIGSAVIAIITAAALIKFVNSYSDTFCDHTWHVAHVALERIALSIAAGLIMFAVAIVCIAANPILLLALSSFWAAVAFIGRGGFATDGFIDLSIFSSVVMLLVAILLRFGRTGRIILYSLFMIGLALPLSASVALEIVEGEARGSIWNYIFATSWTAGIACAAYALSTPEQRFRKFNLRFVAIAFIIFALGFMIVPPVQHWMNSLGSTWHGTTYATFNIFNSVKDYPLITCLTCLFYYGASLRIFNDETVKTVNTVLLIYLALLLKGILMPALFGIRIV